MTMHSKRRSTYEKPHSSDDCLFVHTRDGRCRGAEVQARYAASLELSRDTAQVRTELEQIPSTSRQRVKARHHIRQKNGRRLHKAGARKRKNVHHEHTHTRYKILHQRRENNRVHDTNSTSTNSADIWYPIQKVEPQKIILLGEGWPDARSAGTTQYGEQYVLSIGMLTQPGSMNKYLHMPELPKKRCRLYLEILE